MAGSTSLVTSIAGLLGGLGLFMLAVGMITDGLKLAAGNALRDILGRWTNTPLRGIASGAMITGVVQSSSAVTVATIGFVNAGLLTLPQALGVVYGANIGTTMTGWLVAAIGFKLKVEAFALPMVGIGMLLRLTGSHTRRGSIGEALAGFGLFFIGVDVLQTAFGDLAGSFDLSTIESETFLGRSLFVIMGFLMTLVTQSSSAAIAITLTAATGGVVPLAAAAAMVVGANIGTTSTALISTVGATPNAKRVALAHVAFNGVTGVVALAILPVMLWTVAYVATLLDFETAPAVALALFHTLFNILGVAIMWPMTAFLVRFLAARFQTQAEDLARPRHIDANVTGTPSLALEAIGLELSRMFDIARRMLQESLDSHLGHSVRAMAEALESLNRAVDETVVRIERSRLTAEVSSTLPLILRLTNGLGELADTATRIAAHSDRTPLTVRFVEATRAIYDLDPKALEESEAALLTSLDDVYKDTRERVLGEAAARAITPAQAHAETEWLRDIHRSSDQYIKGRRRLRSLQRRGMPLTTHVEVGDTPAASTS